MMHQLSDSVAESKSKGRLISHFDSITLQLQNNWGATTQEQLANPYLVKCGVEVETSALRYMSKTSPTWLVLDVTNLPQRFQGFSILFLLQERGVDEEVETISSEYMLLNVKFYLPTQTMYFWCCLLKNGLVTPSSALHFLKLVHNVAHFIN